MEFELIQVQKGLFVHMDYITADRMIVTNGTYQFQNNTNTNTTESLKEIGITSDRAVGDMMQPTFETKSYYPINGFVVKKR